MYKVLLVDDDDMILTGLQKLINWKSLNMEIVKTARNGKKALDYISEHPVDIILTDVTMPVLSGIDFIREAQKVTKPFKFILLSGYQEFEYVKKGMHLGASNYLLKPVDKKELYHSLENIRKGFEQEKRYNQADQIVFEGLLGRWIRNELREEQLEQLLENLLFKLPEEPMFSVVIVRSRQSWDWEISFKETCQELDISLFFSLNETEKVIVLAEQTNQEMKLKLNRLNEKMESKCQFFIGTDADDPRNVYKSYKHSLKAKEHADFYEKQLVFNTYKENEMTDLALSELMSDLNKEIFSKNVQRIAKEFNLFISQLQADQMNADNVKRLMYLILVNIHVQFDAIDSDKFLKKTKAIFAAETFKELTRLMETDLLPLDELTKQLLYSELTKQTIEIVQTEYMEDLNLKSVAKVLHVNVMYLGQVFKKETGESFSKYLNHYRINMAKELLLRSKEPVNDIASRIGYQNQGYFYKNFKSLVGRSPREFREQNQLNTNKKGADA